MLVEIKTQGGDYKHTITENSLKITRLEDDHIFYSVNRVTGEIVITYPVDKSNKICGDGCGLIFCHAANRTMVNYCIPVTFSQKNSRPYVKYLGRFRSLLRPEIRFIVGKDALRRINRAINMKITSYALRGSKKESFIPSATIGAGFNAAKG